MNKHLKLAIILIIVLIFGWILADNVGWVLKSFSDLPPGCIDSPFIGGCSGTSKIINLSVSNKPDCLMVRENNCDGGVIVIDNQCNSSLNFRDIEITSGNYIMLDVGGKVQDDYFFVKTDYGNFALYVPEENGLITVKGLYENQTITISFIKTKKLC